MKNFTTWGQINMCTGTPQALPGHSACQAYPTWRQRRHRHVHGPERISLRKLLAFGIINIAWQMFQTKTLL